MVIINRQTKMAESIYIRAVSEIVGLASQFATQNCLGYHSKLSWSLLKMEFG